MPMTTKQQVFKTLYKAANSAENEAAGFVSGQELAAQCNVSRTAVWKAVNSLIKEGIQIQAVTNKGYRLANADDVISIEQLNSFLPENSKITFEVHSVIDSTNSECKRQCTQAEFLRFGDGQLSPEGEKLHEHVIVAESQTAGRGRMGRKFYSPAQNGIYLSMIYIPRQTIIQPAKMTATAAVAVCHAIKKVYGIDAKIKWVNDVFANGKKICGILTEGIANFETGEIQAAIVGIGINICETGKGFPQEISGIAGSLFGEKSVKTKRCELAAQISIELARLYEIQEKDMNSAESRAIMQEYRDLTFLIGKTMEISPVINGQQKFMAKAVDITEDAALVVEKEDGTLINLQSGEVSLSSGKFI
ncbi:MAG: biotin--[acetyl-CoA-carboxylase] ligase [Treponema sp.]|nr:biotin--[acetyl-CoA-carboxylase] ligase [Treponema sp.]